MSMIDVIQGPSGHPDAANMHGEVVQHRGWSPYMDNGGTVLSVVGEDHCVLVADTRMSTGYRINTRNRSKVTQLTSSCVIASAGQQCDALTLHRVLKVRIATYKQDHRKEPNVTSIAQMLSTMLYHKRFMPYYTFNVLSGVDDDGKGACYHYDAIGSFERVPYSTSGSGSSMVLSVLDQHINRSNSTLGKPKYTKAELASLCKDVLHGVAERDIFTGDHYECFVIDSSGVTREVGDLKKD